MNVIYTATGKAIGGRAGRAETPDGELVVNLVRPKELGGAGAGGTNPEQLFACGYAACFASTIEHIAREKKVLLDGVQVVAHIGLGRRAEGGFGLTAKLSVSLPGVAENSAKELLEAAHRTCPYSNAIRGNVDVELGFVTLDA